MKYEHDIMVHSNFFLEREFYCQTRVQTMSRPTLDVSQVLSNSISISDTCGVDMDLSKYYNCFIPPTHHP